MNVSPICTGRKIECNNAQTFHKHVVIPTFWLQSQCLCGGQKPNIYAEKVGGWGGGDKTLNPSTSNRWFMDRLQ